MYAQSILVVDDDPHLREIVCYSLARAGFQTSEARTAEEALAQVGRQPPDLIVLDVMLPGMDGLQLCRELRRERNLPIVFLSSRGEEIDRVVGLELGGDDYLSKPFSPRELVSRVRAVLRRVHPGGVAPEGSERSTLQEGSIRLDPVEHRVFVGDQEVELTATEFQILHVLLARPGRVFRRKDLIEGAYPGRHFVSDRTLDSHMRRIRQKLREAALAAAETGHGLDPIETVHGVGFRLRKA